MNRDLYTAGIFFSAVTIVLHFLFAVGYLTYGPPWFVSGSYLGLYTVLGINAFLGDIILIKYLHYKKFLVAFTILLIAVFLGFVVYFNGYQSLSGGKRLEYINAIILVSMGSGLVFHLSLIFSKVTERPLLKLVGIFGSFIGVIFLTIHIVIWTNRSAPTVELWEEISLWVNVIASLLSILYIKNYFKERSLISTSTTN